MISRAIGNILYTARSFNSFQRQFNLDPTLHPSQYRVISHVVRDPGCNQEDLIFSSGMDKTTMTHRLNSLEENGYIRREVSKEDARCRLVYPTEKAEALYPGIHEEYELFTGRILEGLSEKEINTLTELTNKLRKNAETLFAEINTSPRRKK